MADSPKLQPSSLSEYPAPSAQFTGTRELHRSGWKASSARPVRGLSFDTNLLERSRICDAFPVCIGTEFVELKEAWHGVALSA